MNNEDFQLEELENAAVNKSNNAKRAAAIGATVAGSGAIGAAGMSIYGNQTGEEANNEDQDLLSQEDLDGVAQTGAGQVDGTQPVQEDPAPQTHSSAPQAPIHQPAPTPPAEQEIDITFDKTTHFYGENNELLMTTEEGKLEGRDFMLVDLDNDQEADILAYDANANGEYEDNEIVALDGSDQIAMGNPTPQHNDVFLAQVEFEPEPDPYLGDDDGILVYDDEKYQDDGIHNDFEDEKTGESYNNDYAENNENYNNNGDVDQYSANAELAYEDEEIANDDYEEDFDTLASNDSMADDANDIVNDDIIDIA